MDLSGGRSFNGTFLETSICVDCSGSGDGNDH
jgi:hypothetical protein